MAGIYHNAELGVISMSSDGTNWLTIADKNLGATQVYNDGDTLSEANSGKYYQWGNNHGFSFTGNVTTSSSQVNAASYGVKLGYYESSTFITSPSAPFGWDSSETQNLRGGVTDGNEDKRGPCDIGFHIPSTTEWEGIINLGISIGARSSSDGNNLKNYLHLPFSGSRSGSSSSQQGSGNWGYYWSSSYKSGGSGSYGYELAINSTYIGASSSSGSSQGAGIRPFKNSFEAPTSSWTVIIGTLGSGGIFRDQTNGLISITSDGITGYTILDKNLGATTVYNDGDTLSEANCGKFYQWGNNYGFPWTGSVTTSSTKVDASGYGPTVYYDSDTFITRSSSPYDWSSVQNDNLWGNTTNTNEARQGPSPTGFHVPSITEWEGVKTIMDGFSLTTGDNWRTYLYMPFVGARMHNNATLANQGTNGNYWSSSPFGAGGPYDARHLDLSSSNVYVIYSYYRSYGFSIRPFANTPVVPDYTWERLYGDELPAPKNYIKRFQNNGNYYYFGEPPVHASGVTLNKSSLTLTEAGQTEQLVATVTPSDAIEKSVTWSSSDTTVAMVARDGTITCIDPTGVCTITCTTNDGGYSAICKVPYEYEPNENTLAYRPLDSVNQLADLSGNNLDLGIVSQDASRISFIDNYALFVKNSSGMYSPTFNLPNSFTVACRVYPLEPDAMSYNSIWNWKRGGSDWSKYYQLSVGFGGDPFAYYASLYGVTSIHNTFSSRPNGWLRIVCTFDYTSGVTAMYINGEKLGTSTGTKWSNNGDQIGLGYGIEGAGYGNYLKIGSKLSNFIVEDKVWSDAEVLEDYNLTKGRYTS